MSSESESYSDSDSDSDSVSSEAIEIPLRFPQFPEPIIVEILSRLPVKSLLKFKFVSKSWHSLISSKYFIKTHLENSVKNPTLSRYRCISTIRKSYWKLEHHYLPSFRPRKDIYSSDLDREDDKQKALDLVGSCNGLICFLVGKECSGWWKPVTTVSKPCFVLWNPATKESKILPDFHGGRKNPIQVCIIKCGFGFDEKSDDYKVFAVMSVTKPKMIGATHHETVAKVYSLKSDSWTQIELLEDDTPVDVAGKFASWTRIELLEDDTPVDVAGKFASGKLHWIRNSSRNSRWDIVSFDLTTEASRHVDQPGYVEPGFYPTLGVLDGSLCVLCDYCKTQLDVWIWNEYGNQDSWTKMVSISYLTDPVEGKLSNALCVLPNHEVLFLLDSGFISYNPKRSWIYHPQNLVDSEELIDAEVYVQSLVPLVSENAIKSPVEDGTSTSKKGNSPVKKGTSKKGKAPVKDGTSKKGKPRKNRRSNKK